MARVLLVAYEGRVKGDEKPFEVVEKIPIIVGAGDLLPGLEEVLSEMKEGEEREIELPPEKAFGERKKELIVLIPEREFRKRGIRPVPGLPIEADGRRGRVVAVSSGRVQVDFNHPLAGKTLLYKLRVIKELTDLAEAVEHLFERFFGFRPQSVEITDGVAKISFIIPRDSSPEPLFVAFLMDKLGFKEVRMERIYRLREATESNEKETGAKNNQYL